MLLDTNVTCLEGMNEVLAEDDVSWHLKKVFGSKFFTPSTHVDLNLAEPTRRSDFESI